MSTDHVDHATQGTTEVAAPGCGKPSPGVHDPELREQVTNLLLLVRYALPALPGHTAGPLMAQAVITARTLSTAPGETVTVPDELAALAEAGLSEFDLHGGVYAGILRLRP